MGVCGHRDFIDLHRLPAVICHWVQWARGALYYAISVRFFYDSISHGIRNCFSWPGRMVRGEVFKWWSLWDSARKFFSKSFLVRPVNHPAPLPHHPQSLPSHGGQESPKDGNVHLAKFLRGFWQDPQAENHCFHNMRKGKKERSNNIHPW